jgi:dihydropteroate synthase
MKIGTRFFDFKKRAYVMGVLNRTTDSFSDGGEFESIDAACSHAFAMIEAGVDIIDIGGESSRPPSSVTLEQESENVIGKLIQLKSVPKSYLTNPSAISVEEEIIRVVPVIRAIRQVSDIPISIDTYKSAVARAALDAGANLVNDVRGLAGDPEMAKVVADYKVPVVIMHNRSAVSSKPAYAVTLELIQFFRERLVKAFEAGIVSSNIILDPGYSFQKTFEENLFILKNLKELQVLGFPLLIGTSRKSHLGKIVNVPPKERLGATLASNVVAILHGAAIIRVHDVKEHVQAVQLLQLL